MTEVISVYDTITQADGFLVELPEARFVQNRYFKDTPKTRFYTKKVLLDFDKMKLNGGVWIKKGFKHVNSTAYRSMAVMPPRNGISDIIDPEDDDRIEFEQLCSLMDDNGMGRVDALENLKRIKVMRMAEMIGRSIEKLCIQVLINNAVEGTMETSPDDDTPIPIDVKYYETSNGEGNPQRYVPAIAWGQAGATPYADVCKMCYALKEHGGRAKEILISPQAWQILRNDPTLEKYVSFYHSAGSVLGDPAENDDAERVASIVFDGFALNVWVYSGIYEYEEDGLKKTEQFLPKDFVCVLSEDCGRMFTAGCTKVNPKGVLEADPLETVSFIPRRGKFIASQFVDVDHDELSLRVESKPLPAPKKDWLWITWRPNNTNDVAAGTVGPAIDVMFESEEAGITLPDDLTNIAGGSDLTFKIPNVADKTADIYIGETKVKTAQTPNTDVTVTLPMDDCVITIVYNSAL